MLTMAGVLQIGAIIKEDVTKNGDKVVYFTGYARRGEESDKVFCKVFGKNAEYLLRNLPKKADGSYSSRKIEISGYLETYTQKKSDKCEPYVIQPSDLDASLGSLYQPIQIVVTKEVDEEKFLIRINHLEFVDKKKDANFVEIHASTKKIHEGEKPIQRPANLTNNNDNSADKPTSSLKIPEELKN